MLTEGNLYMRWMLRLIVPGAVVCLTIGPTYAQNITIDDLTEGSALDVNLVAGRTNDQSDGNRTVHQSRAWWRASLLVR